MSDKGLLVGQQIDSFRIEKHLGRGGMADVYLAHDVALKRDVVIKVMLPALAENETLVARFRREAQATARLQHPNIVPVYTTGMTPANQPYIALQYVEGGSLSEHLEALARRGEWVSTIYALAIARQMADALTVAHAADIVHRDVKPSNILLRSDGTPVLSDLGIAAVQQATMRLTQTGGVLGTPNYMSPEQGRGAAVDGRSDIYSLGVILYELLSGKLPFTADSPWSMIHHHIYEAPTPLRQVRAGLAEPTFRVVETCLQKDPAARYQTAPQLVAALDVALAAEGGTPNVRAGTWRPAVTEKVIYRDQMTPHSATAVPAPTPAAQTAERKRPLWLWALIPLVLLLVAAAAFLWPRQAADGPAAPSAPLVAVVETAPVVETAVVVEPTPTAAPPTPQPTATAATPTEGNAMTFTVPATQARAVTNLWVEAGQTVLIEYQSGSWRAGAPPTWPMVGPDGDAQVGSKLTFPVPDAPLASLVGGVGESRPFLVGPRAEFQSPATGVLWLGPNDDDVMDNEGSLVVRVALGPVATVSSPTATPLPAAGPTGVLAFSCGSGQQNQIFLSRPDGSLPYLLPNQPPNSVVPAFSPDGAQIAYRSNADGAWQIYVSDLNGDSRRQVTSGNADNYEAVWSPAGRRFAFVSDRFGSKQIFVMNVDGSNQQPLTPGNVVSDDPSWSSDDVIIYESNQDGRFDIYQISPQGGTPVVLISRGDSSSTPAWSPDGQRLAFEVLVRNVRHIWIANRDGSNLLPVTSQGNNNQRPAWSPDGRYIAFHSDYQQIATQYDIWVIELATQALTRITTRGDCYNPAWTVAPPVLSRTTWPVSPTGVEACHLADGLPVTAGDNARLWPVPDVTAGTALGDLAAGTALTVVGGPEWGPLRRDTDFPGWWWEVATQSGDLRGWLWEARLVECG